MDLHADHGFGSAEPQSETVYLEKLQRRKEFPPASPVHLQRRDKRLLRDFDFAELPHLFLARPLLFRRIVLQQGPEFIFRQSWLVDDQFQQGALDVAAMQGHDGCEFCAWMAISGVAAFLSLKDEARALQRPDQFPCADVT